MPKATEGKLNGRIIGIDEALSVKQREKDVVFRCISCGERIRAHSRGTTDQAAHFEHFIANPECPLSGRG
jgi:hypothetical protein